MKKVEVFMISKRAGHRYLIKGEGEILPIEDVDIDIGQTAVFHAKHYSQDARANWFTVNLWSGLFVSEGTTKKKCLEDFETKRSAYLSLLNNNPERVTYIRKSHEELEKLKEVSNG